jgi:pilus assembly protein Flp/PilA
VLGDSRIGPSPSQRQSEDGASAVEYALLISAIAAVIIITVVAMGGLVRTALDGTCDDFARTDPNASIPADCSS